MNSSSRNPLARAAAVSAVVLACTGTIASAAVRLTVTADARDALIVGDAPRTVTVTLTSDEPGVYELRQQFVDRYGERTDGPTERVRLDDGEWKQQVAVPVEHYGPATYRASVYQPGGGDEPLAQAEQMLVRPVPVPRLNREQRMDSPIGINVHANARWETLADMGIHWARDYSWGWLGHAEQWPKAANGVDFADVEPAADRAGITILPVMQQAFRTEDKKYFITDCDAIAGAYQRLSEHVPQLPYWELDNEADLVHRDETSDEYAKWYQTYLQYIPCADRGLSAAGNGAQVVLNGEAGIHVERTRELLETVGEHFAVVNYHFYTGTVAPELAREDINTGAESRPRTISFLDQLRQINRVAHEAGKEAWLTEIGWSARSGPAVGDRLQSAYLQRMYLISRWAGTDKTFWFWDRELPPGGRFSSTELIHKDEGARPAGAAMAAVSKFTALANHAGSVDVGDDRWALVFERPEGGYLVAAWAVESEYELPETLADAEEAFSMYGNPLRNRRLTAEPAYFHLSELPQAWTDQLDVELLSPSIVNIYQGAEAEVEAHVPTDGQVEWQDLPAGAEGASWAAGDGERQTATLRATPGLAAGTYAVTAVAKGDGWQKRFPLTLRVRPAVSVEAVPFTPGETTDVALSNLLFDATRATLSTDTGEVQPSTVDLSAGGQATARFTAPDDTTAPVRLSIELSNGASQQHWIRPRHLGVPRAGSITIDGDLSDWPDAGGTLPANALKVTGPLEDFAPRMRLAWSPEGLYVASVIPVGAAFTPPAKPQEFWEWTGVELNMNAADVASEPGVTRSHLLYFTPTSDDGGETWRVYAGEWLKPMPDGEKQTINDDLRPRTAARYDGETMTVEVLIPAEVLDTTPQPSHEWPFTINTKIAKALSPRTVAAWPAGQREGWEGWGRIRFEE